MFVNLMEEEYLWITLEHSLPSLKQWFNCDRSHNTHEWPAVLNTIQTVILPLLKELLVFTYK
jgi:hypothetical protein